MTDNNCHCGRPIQGNGNLCTGCGDNLATNLHRIADRWAELETALRWRDILPGAIGVTPADARKDASERKLAIATGINVNERAVRARRVATDAVWFAVQVIREDFDQAGWEFKPPRTSPNRSQDDTPAVARWIAANHVGHFTHKAAQETAEEVLADIATAEERVFEATHPSGVHWAPVNLVCDQFGTSDMGERVPCMGDMWAQVGKDTMPDLVCDQDESHTIAPGVWERAGWKRRLGQPMHEDGAAKLLGAIFRQTS